MLVHETAHEMLHKAERRTANHRPVRDTEAEPSHSLLATPLSGEGSASTAYIPLYHGNASLLAESLGVIQQTASVIFAALESPWLPKLRIIHLDGAVAQ